MYAMVCTRPDIGHAVGVVSMFMWNPGKAHWEAVKWILRYLRGTTEKCLYFGKGDIKVKSYVDADFAGEVDHRRSTTGYIFTVGTGAVSWMSWIQKIVALFHYRGWVCSSNRSHQRIDTASRIVNRVRIHAGECALYSDRQSAIHLAKNSAFHSRTKHIGLHYHFIRSLLEDDVVTLIKIQGSKNPADMLTKVMTIDKLKLCSTSVGLLEWETREGCCMIKVWIPIEISLQVGDCW
jgi:hypothetical protein